jgi:hypothetical protein
MRRPIIITLCCAIATLAIACSSGGGVATPTTPAGITTTPVATPINTPATDPEEALRRYVQRVTNQSFVADCDKAERPGDVGKQCARLRGERNGLLAYEVGPTFAEYIMLIILQPTVDGWTIAHFEHRDPRLPPAPGIPWPLEIGAHVVVAGTAPDCLKVRATPGLNGNQTECLDDGTAVEVVAGPADADDLEWWQIKDHGWASSQYLRYPDEGPTPTADN